MFNHLEAILRGYTTCNHICLTYASHVPVEKCFALYSPSFPISLPTFLAVFVFPSSDFPSFPRETGSRCGTFPINAAVLEISACLQYCSTPAQPVVNNAFNNDNKRFINQGHFWGAIAEPSLAPDIFVFRG